MYIFLLYLVDKENIGGLEDQLEREPGLVDEGEEDDLSAARLLLGGPAQQLQATAGTVCTPAQLVYRRVRKKRLVHWHAFSGSYWFTRRGVDPDPH